MFSVCYTNVVSVLVRVVLYWGIDWWYLDILCSVYVYIFGVYVLYLNGVWLIWISNVGIDCLCSCSIPSCYLYFKSERV